MRRTRTFQLTGAGMAAIGVSFGFARYGYGLFLPEFRADFGLSVTDVGLIGSASYAGYLAALLVVGALVARLGPRPLVVTGGLCAATGSLVVASADSTAWLVGGLVLAGSSPGWAWAPYSDAVDRLVPRARQQAVAGAIATGTACAVAVSGPLALIGHGTGWRPVWTLFGAAALAATLWNARVLPSGPHGAARTAPVRSWPGPRWFLRPGAVPVHLTAVLYGLVGAVYWAFAVEAVEASAGGSVAAVPVFWTAMGLAGVAGVLTGGAIGRFGLRRVHTVLFAGMAVATALLAAAPGSPPALLLSAVLYGPCFMAGSGLLAVWSHRVFPDQPSTGFSATVFFLGLGTLAGPAVLGLAADTYGLRLALAVTAALGTLSLAVRPRTERSTREREAEVCPVGRAP
ncbi:YbfB/YjiJ family MFS transporter [Streptomyces albiaxialis]|uniref:YbfB/YjiJ family MFS transporter n=1 Tax=Streptomyces albiaxialis TaxID=329523 RepID=A0ABP5H492_9ACTN